MASNGSNPWNRNNVPGPAGDERTSNTLRQPKAPTQSRVLNIVDKNSQENQKKHQTQQEPQHFALPVIERQLNVNAEVFVPRAQTKLTVNAAEFVPSQANDVDNNHGLQQLNQRADVDANSLATNLEGVNLRSDSYAGYMAETVLSMFQHVLAIMLLHPGNMEEYLRPVCESIHRGEATDEDVTGMVESLFEQSLQESNFRYTGARICQYLSSNLKDMPHFTNFKKIFIQRCQKEYMKREELLNGRAEDEERLRGLSMFMAEIFLNVETELEDGTIQRLQFLPTVLMDLQKCLLSKPNDLNIKCSCMLFKLSGALVEDIVKNDSEKCEKFESIFSTLQSLRQSQNISEDAKLRIDNVISLKEANWNRSTSSPTKMPSNFSTSSSFYMRQEPVFYNPKGETVSRVEAGQLLEDEEEDDFVHVLNDDEEEALRQFEAEQNGGINQYNSESFGNCVDDGGGMSLEDEEVFDEYLKWQQQQQQQQQQSHHYNHMQQMNQQNIYHGGPHVNQDYYHNHHQQQQYYGGMPPPQQQYQNYHQPYQPTRQYQQPQMPQQQFQHGQYQQQQNSQHHQQQYNNNQQQHPR